MRIFIVLFFILTASACSAEEINVTAKTDKQEYYIGDRIKFDIMMEGINGLETHFPETLDLDGIDFIRSEKILSGHLGSNTETRRYIISIYSVGNHVIPPIDIEYRKKDDTRHTVRSPQFSVEIISLLTPQETEIRDIKGIVTTGGGLFWVVFLLIIALLAICAVIWRKRIKKKETLVLERKKTAHEIAYEQLMSLKERDYPGKGLIKEYYTDLSDIVRHYLENRFNLRAPEMTTEEFLEYVKTFSDLVKEHKMFLKDFLSHCDMVKFAKYGPTKLEMLDSLHSVEHLLDQTRFEAEKPKLSESNAG